MSSPERLAIYNRQYWFRLFTVFHGAFPLTTRQLGHFCFNEYASRFLLAHPPKVWDIDAVVDGFEDFLVLALPSPTVTVDPRGRSVERAAVLQASRIDAAYHHVFRAPACTAFRPSAGDAERLLTSRLQPSPAAAVLEEDWLKVAQLTVQVAERLNGIKIAQNHRMGTPWVGAYRKMLDG